MFELFIDIPGGQTCNRGKELQFFTATLKIICYTLFCLFIFPVSQQQRIRRVSEMSALRDYLGNSPKTFVTWDVCLERVLSLCVSPGFDSYISVPERFLILYFSHFHHSVTSHSRRTQRQQRGPDETFLSYDTHLQRILIIETVLILQRFGQT